MMRLPPARLILAACLLALAGCGHQAAEPQPSPTASPLPAPPPVNAPATLEGEWRVAGIDGAPLDAAIGIALSIDRSTMAYDPRCAGFIWDYRFAEGRLTARRREGPRCEIGYDPVLDRLAAALDSVRTAARTPANGVELSGGGHSVTLFSQ